MLLPLLMNLGMLGTAVSTADTAATGAARYRRKRKKPIEVIRWSDFEMREKRAEALARALAEAAIPIREMEEDDTEEIDDEILLKALTVLLH